MNNYDELVEFVQQHFTDGLALVIGSGLSVAEGIPGMTELAEHLRRLADSVAESDKLLWARIESSLKAGDGLEAALLKHPPSDTLELWIAKATCDLLVPKEREVMSAVLQGGRQLRLTTLLTQVLKPTSGLPILTPNYDRLIELACEMAGFHVDTTAVGHYAGVFDHSRSCMGSCKGITTRARTTVLQHYPRAIVLKPHGSLDWYRNGDQVRRCSLDLDAERMIITPGTNKYRAGYDSPFDKHRELANEHINKASRLLIVGYGFNDDHLQTHLIKSIRDGTPTLILNMDASPKVQSLANESPRCVCISKMAVQGAVVMTKGHRLEHMDQDLWDLAILAEEMLK